MKRPITNRTLSDIKVQAKKRCKEDPSRSHCQYLNLVATEIAGVSSFHEAVMLSKKNAGPAIKTYFDALEGMSREERERFYDFMASALGREVLEIYPESNDYYSDADFDVDDYDEY